MPMQYVVYLPHLNILFAQLRFSHCSFILIMKYFYFQEGTHTFGLKRKINFKTTF